jgi:hypothetical protein
MKSMEIPECEPDPEIDKLQDEINSITMSRCRQAMAAAADATARQRERESVHALFLIARDGTYQDIYRAMCRAFGKDGSV